MLFRSRDPSTEAIDPWALDIVNLADSYAEVTPSGTGLRVLGTGDLVGVHRKFSRVGSDEDDALEIYGPEAKRYITITGLTVENSRSDLADISNLTRRLLENRGRLQAHSEPKCLVLPPSADVLDFPHAARKLPGILRGDEEVLRDLDRKSTRLNSSH